MGRPILPPEFVKKPALPSFCSIIDDIRTLLTYLECVRQNVSAMLLDAVNFKMTILRDLLERADELRKVETEMSKLEKAYQRFRELADKAETLRNDIHEAAAVIGTEDFMREAAEEYPKKNVGLLPPIDKLRERLPLWRALVHIVRAMPWIRIVDLEDLLQEMDFNVSRAAIESALEVHKKVFRIKRIERAKFVALRD